MKIPMVEYHRGFRAKTIVGTIIGLITIDVVKSIMTTKIINERFRDNLNRWSIPLGSGWTIQKNIEGPGKVLSVTKSRFPGTLKETYSWYDYEVSFQAWMKQTNDDKQYENIGIVVRAENNLNGVLLQVTKTHFRPFLIQNSNFILDSNGVEQLPTILNYDEWIPIKILVSGNYVTLSTQYFRINYKIPTLTLTIEPTQLYFKPEIDLKDLEANHKENKMRWDNFWKRYRENQNETNLNVKLKKDTELNEEFGKMPKTESFNLEFQKGSIGFRQDGNEQTYFRNLKVKKFKS